MARSAAPSVWSNWSGILSTWRVQAFLLALCALGLYANTLDHQFVLDDGLVLSDNAIVQKGIRGIPDILTKDSFFGSIGESAFLCGGRYRPLPLITYSIEVSFFGLKPGVHHLVNVLLYALTGLVLLRLLRRSIFPDHPMAAFVATLLFVFHPLHTEVVANIKSRDELLSLLFLLLTLHYLLVHRNRAVPTSAAAAPVRGKQKPTSTTKATAAGNRALLAACLFFALALLSKENGVVFLLIVPLTIHFFTPRSLMGALRASLPIIAITASYLVLRFALLGTHSKEVTEVMDNPYLLATAPEKIATILFVFLKYIGLLFVPHPLTYDYSFHQIPYRSFSEPWVIVSIAVLTGLFVLVLRGIKKKDLLVWCIVFFLATFVLVSGLFFNIGAPMAERFMYQGSVPFIIALVECGLRLLNLLQERGIHVAPISFAAVVLVALSASAFASVRRNAAWHTSDELFLNDVKTSPNSARANTYAGIAWIHLGDATNTAAEKRSCVTNAIALFRRSESIKRMYTPNFLNLGAAYVRLDDPRSAEAAWDTARTLEPNSPLLKEYEQYLFHLYYRSGLKAGVDRDNAKAIADLRKALRYGQANPDAWYNLGGAYFTTGDTAEARSCWERTLHLDPRNVPAQQGLAALRR